MSNSYVKALEGLLGDSHIGDWTGNLAPIGHIRMMNQRRRTAPGPQGQAQEQDKFSETERWQFWPRSMAMGSSLGNQFFQVSHKINVPGETGPGDSQLTARCLL